MELFIKINFFICILFLLLFIILGLVYGIYHFFNYYFCNNDRALDDIFSIIGLFTLGVFTVSGTVIVVCGLVLALIKLTIGGTL